MQNRCREYFEYVSEFIDGELNDSICKKIQKHLDECPECQECLDSLKRTINLCKNISKGPISHECHKRIMEKLREYLDA